MNLLQKSIDGSPLVPLPIFVPRYQSFRVQQFKALNTKLRFMAECRQAIWIGTPWSGSIQNSGSLWIWIAECTPKCQTAQIP